MCKHCPEMTSSERKHLRMQVFHKNKDIRSKDQNKKRIYFISGAMKASENNYFRS